MDTRFEELFKQGIDEYLTAKGLARATANSIQLGRALIEYYMQEIGSYLFRILEDDINDCICDGKGDLGIDFAWRQEHGWLIIQSKFKGQNSNVTSAELSDFFNLAGRLDHQGFYDKHASNSVKNSLHDYQTGDSIHFIFLTNDKISLRIEDEFKNLQLEAEGKNGNLTYEIKGMSAIKQDYKSVMSEGDSLTEEVEILIDSVKDTLAETDRDAYV